MDELTQKRCMPCEGGVAVLTEQEEQIFLNKVHGWVLEKAKIKKISRIFKFENYYQNIAFVNAIAWLSHKEGHHPHLEIEYGCCIVKYWTHAINGLSENDFICASKVNELFSIKQEELCNLYN